MHPLTRYYIHQAGGAGGSGVGPIYSLPPYVQRGHGIGDYLGPLFRAIKPWFFSGAKAAGKALGRVALRTGVKFFLILLTTQRDTKTSFLNTFRILF